MRKNIAFIYDFDGTLSPMNMQEYSFMDAVGVCDKNAFWAECRQMATDHNANSVLCYMRLMLEKSRANHTPITRQKFVGYGLGVELYPGVSEWFGLVNGIGESMGLDIRHYINSSGLLEIIEGTPIAKSFNGIYASSYMYDENGVAIWPATAIDFTAKTQVLWMINKGVERPSDAADINKSMPTEDRPVPFTNMLYFGDGETDVPSMQIVRSYGGHSFAVYNPDDNTKMRLAQKLLADRRVNYALEADYRQGSELFRTITGILEDIASAGR